MANTTKKVITIMEPASKRVKVEDSNELENTRCSEENSNTTTSTTTDTTTATTTDRSSLSSSGIVVAQSSQATDTAVAAAAVPILSGVWSRDNNNNNNNDNKNGIKLFQAIKSFQSKTVINLLEKYPTLISYTNEKCMYPLHYICQFGGITLKTQELLLPIYSLFPEAVQHKDIYNMYPLHYSCRYNIPENFVLLLIHSFPTAVCQKGNDGWYPIHYGFCYCQSKKVLLQLLDIYPQVIFEKDGDGYCLLHRSCQYKQYQSMIVKLCDMNPNACKEINNDGFYPLQYALSNKAPGEIIIKLLNVFPTVSSMIIKDDSDSYPLHYACCYIQQEQTTITSNLILQLIDKYPHAIQHQDSKGRYPLHIICRNKHIATDNKEIVFNLVKKYPQALHTMDTCYCYPIDYAIRYHLPESFLHKFIDQYPQQQQAAITDIHRHNDQTTLQYALIAGQSESIILKLLLLCPQAAMKGTKEYGGYPLFYARTVCYKYSEDLLYTLLDMNLMVVTAVDQHGKRLDYYVQKQQSKYNTLPNFALTVHQLSFMSDYDIQNCINIPTIIQHKSFFQRRKVILKWLRQNFITSTDWDN
jgi:ankyrin repeat protein